MKIINLILMATLVPITVACQSTLNNTDRPYSSSDDMPLAVEESSIEGSSAKNSPANSQGSSSHATQARSQPLLIAHAGGGIDGARYCNCKEALDRAYKDWGFRYFELDFHWTSDDRLVLIHDWKRSYKQWFGDQAVEGEAPSLEQFTSLRMKNDRTQLDLADLVEWLEDYPEARVVTDVKSSNLKALSIIATRYPQLQKQFIPQIYQFDEYDAVVGMGYDKVILTLYRLGASDSEIVEFAQSHPLFAVTVWRNKLAKGSLAEDLTDAGVPVFVHTLNYQHQALPFWQRGVSGIYTDFLDTTEAAALAAGEVQVLGAVVGGEEKTATVDVSGSEQMVLFVRALGGKSHDHANWCDLTLTLATGEAVSLTAAQLVDSRQGWGELKKNRSVEGNRLVIGDYQCESGWGTHAPSQLVFDLSENDYESLSLGYGIDREVGEKGEVEFGVILIPEVP